MRRAVVLVLAACSSHPAAQHPVAPAASAPQQPELTADVVLAKVRGGYTTGVQRCYTRYLKNRSGHGRVLVSFTVDAQGRAMDGAATGVPSRLGGCIVAEVARWRFPAPASGQQSFALPIDLIAD